MGRSLEIIQGHAALGIGVKKNMELRKPRKRSTNFIALGPTNYALRSTVYEAGVKTIETSLQNLNKRSLICLTDKTHLISMKKIQEEIGFKMVVIHNLNSFDKDQLRWVVSHYV